MRKFLFILLFILIYIKTISQTADWDNKFTTSGLIGTVYTIAADDSGNIYAGGDFKFAGNGKIVNNIAKWNGTVWSPLGDGFNYIVFSIAINKNEVYAAGAFSYSGSNKTRYIAKWNGVTWNSVGGGCNNTVKTILFDKDTLYVGGHFDSTGTLNTRKIAKWDGIKWSKFANGLGSTMNGEYVNIISKNGNKIYIGGKFLLIGTDTVNNIAQWDGVKWTKMTLGITGSTSPEVKSMAMIGSNLYVGGSFSKAGNTNASNLAIWDGYNWTEAHGGVDGYLTSIFADGANLYICGNFSTVGKTLNTNSKAKWDGSKWVTLGNYVYNNLYSIFYNNNNVYIGGIISGYYDFNGKIKSTFGIVRNQNAINYSMGTNKAVDGYVNAVVAKDTIAYLAGSFDYAGSQPLFNVAKWDGHTFTPLSTGLSSRVNALLWEGSDLYVGGEFNTNGYIQKWNGTSWSKLGSGLGWNVYAMAKKGTNLYVGGEFTTLGTGTAAKHIAQWDGISWSPMGAGIENTVTTIEVDDSGNVYAVDYKYISYGNEQSYIYKWNGTVWKPISNEINGKVSSLRWWNGKLYAGGAYNEIPGIFDTKNIACWDGLVWKSVTNVNIGSITTMTCDSFNLYLGGYVYYDGSYGIIKYDGNSWFGFKEGLRSGVNCIAVSGNHVYAGGSFNLAGDKVSLGFAHWYYLPDQAVSILTQPISQSLCIGKQANFYVSAEGTGPINFQWYKNNALIPSKINNTIVISTTSISDSGNYYCKIWNKVNTIYSDTVRLTSWDLPKINLGKDTILCKGKSLLLDAGNSFIYKWNDNSTNQFYNVNKVGKYSVTIRDNHSCENYDSIQVNYIYPYAKQQICIVTVDSTSEKNMITWEKPILRNSIDTFRIYRETSTMGQFKRIGSVHFDSLSLFIDSTSTPRNQQHLYKITTIDSCGNESSLDSSDTHKTLLLQYSGSAGGVNLSWSNRYEVNGNPYPFVRYVIYRSNDSLNLDSIATVSGSLFAYIDTDPKASVNRMYYRVGGVMASNCKTRKLKTSTGPFSQSVSNLEDNRIKGQGINSLTEDQIHLSISPNPFTDIIHVSYFSPIKSIVKIEIVNMLGKNVGIIENEKPIGNHIETISAIDYGLKEGIYLLKLDIAGIKLTRQIVLHKSY